MRRTAEADRLTMVQRWAAFTVAVALVAVASLALLLGTTSPAAAHTHGDLTFTYDESPDLLSTRTLAAAVADGTKQGRVERSFRGGGISTGGEARAETNLQPAGHVYGLSVIFVAPTSALGRGDVFTAHRTGMSGLEASLDPDGILELYIVRGSATPAGHKMFDEALEAFGDNVGGIRGSWWDIPGLDANYRQFQASIDAGLSADAAALSTFTGQNAARHGFSQVESVVNGVGEVTVVFRRGD